MLETTLDITTYQTVPSILLNGLVATGEQCVLQHLDITVYALLKSYARTKTYCWPSYERLALQSGCSVSSIQRSLKRLEKAGHIQRKSKGKTGKIFILTDVTENGVVKRPAVIETVQRAESRLPPVVPIIQTVEIPATIEEALVPVMDDAMVETIDDDDPPF